MIRTDFCEYLLHPNDLLSLFPDSVKFVCVNTVASLAVHVDPVDTVGMYQGAENRMCRER
jgi:hypothetical protein